MFVVCECEGGRLAGAVVSLQPQSVRPASTETQPEKWDKVGKLSQNEDVNTSCQNPLKECANTVHVNRVQIHRMNLGIWGQSRFGHLHPTFDD